MTRTMFDGITAADVPDGWGVAGYVDGHWPDFTALVLRWPGVVHISIAASAGDDAKCLDVETGDATPAQAPAWTSRQRANGDPYPWVYCNESTWAEVIYEFAQQRVAAPLYWIAQYDGVPVVPPGAIAKQHTNTPGYDQSAVADYVPGIDPAPEGDTMALTPTDALLVANTLLDLPIPRAGHAGDGVETGTTSLRALIAWADAGIQGTRDEITAEDAAIAKLAADPKATA
jgi:hypothetical protein